ncbi:MAG: NADP-specific glutamate dehydrogenase, partial [Anaerotignum sp.]|nr:NADP-specific glutamate dehydrogenase [Anaerotignum sp.]
SDFNPNGKSDMEIMRFCQAFMTELYRHIGPDVDVPAGDIGVAGREIGFMYGQYKRIKGCWENGVLTGKGLEYGGSLFRPEATGYGAVYYTNEVLVHENDTFEGKTVAMSGFGNVAWGVAQKVAQLGGKVVTLSGPDGYCYDPEGITTQEKFDYMVEMRTSGRNRAQDYAEKFGVEFFPGQKPWGVKVDIAMPCAYQNEIGMTEIKQILDENGTKYYIEVANMPTTNEALGYAMAKEGVIVAPSKAVNAGGVAVSALEMAQNSMRYAWEGAEVDAKLVGIMKNIHAISVEAAEGAGMGYNLVAGANIAGFKKVAAAMMAQGLV